MFNSFDTQTIVVDTTEDEISDNGQTSLREAILEANSNPSKSYIIQLQSGARYALTLNKTGFSDTSRVGDLDIDDDANVSLQVVGGQAKAVIDAGSLQVRDRVFEVDEQASLSLDNVIVTGGLTDTHGGGILLQRGAELTLTNTIVENNFGERLGGGIAAFGQPAFRATVNLLDNSVLRNNTAERGGGAFGQYTDFNIRKSEIIDNLAQDSFGGGISTSDFSSLIFKNSLASGNEAEIGGAIHTSRNIETTIEDSVFERNTAESLAGALSLSNQDEVKGTINNVEFKENRANTSAGAVLTTGEFELKKSRFENNFAGKNGGALLLGLASSSLVENTIFNNNEAVEDGGHVLVEGGVQELRNVQFLKGKAGNDGGALSLGDSFPNVQVHDSLFDGNEALRNGGAFSSSRAEGSRTIEFVDTVFQKNIAGIFGGAADIRDRTDTIFEGVSFLNNQADSAGALYVSGGDVSVSESIAQGNEAIEGGAFVADYSNIFSKSGNLTASRSLIADNEAVIGGGVFVRAGGEYQSDNSTYSGNKSKENGAGVYVFFSAGLVPSGKAILTNNTFAGNVSDSDGNQVGDYTIFTLQADPFDDTTSDGELSLYNNLIAENTNVTSAIGGDLPVEAFNNLIDDIDAPTGFNETNLLNVDARLGALDNNGGKTPTYDLLANSLAINGGNNDFVVGDTDQRGAGFERIVNDTADLGAFELQNQPPQLPPEITVGDVSIAEGNSGTQTLEFTITLSEASAENISVDYTTANGTATAGEDYAATNGTLNFAASVTQQTITVSINGDTDVEENETFVINLSNPTNATLAKAQGTATIIDDEFVEPPLKLNFGNSTISFGSAGNETLQAATDDSVSERIYAGRGEDRVIISGAKNRIFGGAGADFLDASTGAGNNRIFGGAGADELFGGSSDLLIGGEGDDTLTGGGDSNLMIGGPGADTFAIGSPGDTILDFETGIDKFDIDINGESLSLNDIVITKAGDNTTISFNDNPLVTLIGELDLAAEDFV